MKRHLTILCAGLLLAAAPALADTSVNVTRAVDADASIQVDNLAGTVKVVGWDRNSAHVTGRLGSSDLHLKVNGDKQSLTIRVVYPHEEHRNFSHGSNLTVHVPKGATMQVQTVSASITGSGLTGTQRLQTVSGDIKLESKAPEIDAKSVSGDIAVTGSAPGAHVEMNTVSGSAHASNLNGELVGETVSGNVSVGKSRLQRATLNATSGTVKFQAPIEAKGTYKFHNVSGRIVLGLLGKPDAEFDLNSFSGSIRNTFGPKPQKTSQYAPGVELHFTRGQGGAYVKASSMSGDIVLNAGG